MPPSKLTALCVRLLKSVQEILAAAVAGGALGKPPMELIYSVLCPTTPPFLHPAPPLPHASQRPPEVVFS